MFRTSNSRGQQRFDDFRLSHYNKTAKLTLSKKQVAEIEKTSALTIGDKVELLLIALGNKLTGEMYMKVHYEWNETEQLELPNSNELAAIESLLKNLPFIYFQDTLPMKNRQNGKMQRFVWFQVSVNEAVSHFMKNYANDLTEFEEGVLYGFPLSAIRAFSRLIEARHDKPNAATYYLSGFCSADFWEDEQEYYKLWWERLRKLSPKIVAEAEEKFKNQN